MRAFSTIVMSIIMYGAETWSVTQKDLRKPKTFQMKFLRDIMGVSRWDQICNDSILESTSEVPIADQVRHARLH